MVTWLDGSNEQVPVNYIERGNILIGSNYNKVKTNEMKRYIQLTKVR